MGSERHFDLPHSTRIFLECPERFFLTSLWACITYRFPSREADVSVFFHNRATSKHRSSLLVPSGFAFAESPSSSAQNGGLGSDGEPAWARPSRKVHDHHPLDGLGRRGRCHVSCASGSGALLRRLQATYRLASPPTPGGGAFSAPRPASTWCAPARAGPGRLGGVAGGSSRRGWKSPHVSRLHALIFGMSARKERTMEQSPMMSVHRCGAGSSNGTPQHWYFTAAAFPVTQ